jgi:hypothetical protein
MIEPASFQSWMQGSRLATTTTRSPCSRARSVCLRRRAVHGVTPESSLVMSAFDTGTDLRLDFRARRLGAGKAPLSAGLASDATTAEAAATHADPTRDTPLTALTSAPAALQTWTIPTAFVSCPGASSNPYLPAQKSLAHHCCFLHPPVLRIICARRKVLFGRSANMRKTNEAAEGESAWFSGLPVRRHRPEAGAALAGCTLRVTTDHFSA